MATNTSYLGLTKPAQSDLYNVDVFNDNADTVDANAQKTAANLATIEAVATASKPYVVGEYLVLNGILYKVTQAIANGGALVVGTNIAQDNVGTELKSIKESLSTLTNAFNGSVGQTNLRFLESSSNKTNHTINVPNSALHFLIIGSTSYGIHAYGMVGSTSSGAIKIDTMQKTDGITLTTGSGTITVNVGSTARPLYVFDILVYGGWCTLS